MIINSDRIDPLWKFFFNHNKFDNHKGYSIADIGSGKNPVYNTLLQYMNIDQFYCVEEDKSFHYPNPLKTIDFNEFKKFKKNFDIINALEVIEHINKSNILNFFETILNKTNIAFFFTTPNFENFNNSSLEVYRKDREIRYVPDSIMKFNPQSIDPHVHKIAFARDDLYDYLHKNFNDIFHINVFKAWPWTIHDSTRSKTYIHNYKIFGILINKSFMNQNLDFSKLHHRYKFASKS